MAPSVSEESINDVCDESKCVSTGLSNSSFTCYGDVSNSEYPMMCADGFLPRIVDTEPPVVYRQVRLQYFTCCPPNFPPIGKTNLARHCSDPRTTTPDNSTSFCDDKTQTYFRKMKTRRVFSGNSYDEESLAIKESHMCCDSVLTDDEILKNTNITSSTTNYLNDTECVPYHNEFYEKSRVWNEYGQIAALRCEFPNDSAAGFPITHLLETPLGSIGYEYECCKTGSPSPPFVRDSSFALTIYPQIVLSSISVLCSAMIILGLSIPFLIYKARRKSVLTEFSRLSSSRLQLPMGSQQRSQQFHSSLRFSNAELAEFVRESLRRRQSTRPRLGTYNLYLVYLAIPDLLINLYFVAMYSLYASNTTFHPGLSGFIVVQSGGNNVTGEDDDDGKLFTAILSGYWTANIYLNALVAYEVYVLLRNSKNFQKHRPPSVRTVTLQGMGVCFFSVIVATSYYFLTVGIEKANREGAEDLSRALYTTQKILFNAILLGFVPWIFFPTVCGLIWYRGLIPSTIGGGTSPRDRALRELAWYFFRIVTVFACCWIPVAMLSAFGGTWSFSATFLLLALQQILSTCVSLTKSDVRKHIVRVFTLQIRNEDDPESITSKGGTSSTDGVAAQHPIATFPDEPNAGPNTETNGVL